MTRLVPFAEELWLAEGPVVRFLGLFPYPTRMAVVRLPSGALWVWSPVALDEGLAAEVDALGPVRHLVAPNKLHHLFLGEWARRHPEARRYAAPGLARKRRDLTFHAELGDGADPSWEGAIESLVFRGSFALEEVLFLHRRSRTALVCDLVQRFEPERVHGLSGAVLRLWGLVGEGGSTPREWRATFWNRRTARRALRRAVAWSPERLVVAHGACASDAGRRALARGLRWLGEVAPEEEP